MTDKKLNTHAHLKSTNQWIRSAYHTSTHQTDATIYENRKQKQ